MFQVDFSLLFSLFITIWLLIESFSLTILVQSLHTFSLQERNVFHGESDEINSSHIYPTAIHLYYRGTQRGLGIYIGDSFCRFSSYSINGTLAGRVSASADRDAYTTIEQLSDDKKRDPSSISYCSPREVGGVGKMSRIGQVFFFLIY